MKRQVATGLGVVLAVAITTAASAETAQERFEQTYAFSAGQRLTLTNTNGDVYVEPWDRSEIRVRATKKVKARGGDADAALAELRIEVDVDGSGVEIDTIYPSWKRLFGWSHVSASVDYEIQLPREANLDVRTVNGEIEVSGLDGEIRLRSTNGGIAVLDAAGSVSASTTNGGIKVELDRVSSEGMEFETTNGGIRVDLPSSVQASVRARTTNGSIETDFPVTVHGTFRRNRLEGDINGGGPAIELRTTNGGIRLRER